MNKAELLKDLEEIALDCTSEDWDAYESTPVDLKTIRRANSVIWTLPDLDTYEICPLNSGTISIHATVDKRPLKNEIGYISILLHKDDPQSYSSFIIHVTKSSAMTKSVKLSFDGLLEHIQKYFIEDYQKIL